jgi:hypothetical protein
MTRTKNHQKGDNVWNKKNRAKCKRIPRKPWKEGKLINKNARKIHGLEAIIEFKKEIVV